MERVRAIERTELAGLSPNDERAVRTWLADIAAMPARARQTNVERQEKL